MILCFILIFIYANFVISVRHTDFGNGFAALPSSSEWKGLVKGLKGCQIQKMVHTYMAPVMEYQEAARNREIDVEHLKTAFLTAIALLQESAKNFELTSDEYQDAKEDPDSFLIMPSAAFKLKKAEKLAPVFTVESLENFSRLRLKHMLGNKDTSYITFLMRKNSYENTLEEWGVLGSRMPKCSYRALLARNLDLPYIEHMTAVYLNVIRIRGKGDKFAKKLPRILQFVKKFRQDKVIKKIEALGNGYSTSKPPYSGFLIVVCTFYALLITVMF